MMLTLAPKLNNNPNNVETERTNVPVQDSDENKRKGDNKTQGKKSILVRK